MSYGHVAGEMISPAKTTNRSIGMSYRYPKSGRKRKFRSIYFLVTPCRTFVGLLWILDRSSTHAAPRPRLHGAAFGRNPHTRSKTGLLPYMSHCSPSCITKYLAGARLGTNAKAVLENALETVVLHGAVDASFIAEFCKTLRQPLLMRRVPILEYFSSLPMMEVHYLDCSYSDTAVAFLPCSLLWVTRALRIPSFRTLSLVSRCCAILPSVSWISLVQSLPVSSGFGDKSREEWCRKAGRKCRT